MITKILNPEEVEQSLIELLEAIDKGAIFIYPTDTIYGIGCNALNPKSVQKIREIKQQFDRPFSVIAPSLDWIKETCVMHPEAEDWFKKLPGAYTLIMKTKTKNVPKEVTLNSGTLGIRIPDHWVIDLARRLGKPLVTTSVNKSGEEVMTTLDNLNPAIKSKCDFIIYEGEINGRPSTLVNLHESKATIKKR
jgi:tRNA threonylcarbamoyl adenosine modification protein (Sua5/YciO/YrdC/YwlC family)